MQGIMFTNSFLPVRFVESPSKKRTLILTSTGNQSRFTALIGIANSIDINTEVSKITAQYSELIYLKKIGSLDEVGNGQEYYTDGINYYIPFDEVPGPFNWPDGLCYVESLEIK